MREFHVSVSLICRMLLNELWSYAVDGRFKLFTPSFLAELFTYWYRVVRTFFAPSARSSRGLMSPRFCGKYVDAWNGVSTQVGSPGAHSIGEPASGARIIAFVNSSDSMSR